MQLKKAYAMSYNPRMDLSVLPSEEDMPLPVCEHRPRHPQDSDTTASFLQI
jgi:hypothetical protein